MPIFRSKAAEDVDLIAERLRVAQADVAAIGNELSAVVLEASLSPDPDQHMAPYRARLEAAERLVSVLLAGLAQAKQKEDARLAQARSDADKARHRSIAQKVGQMTTLAADYTAAAENLHAKYLSLAAQISRVWDGLNSVERMTFPALNPDRLRFHCNNEHERLAIAFTRTETPGALTTPKQPAFPEVAVRDRPDLAPLSRYFEQTRDYAADIFAGRKQRPPTLAEMAEQPPLLTKVDAAGAVASASQGAYAVVDPEQFKALVAERARQDAANKRSHAALEKYGSETIARQVRDDALTEHPASRPGHVIEVDDSPEGRASLAEKFRELFSDGEDQ